MRAMSRLAGSIVTALLFSLAPGLARAIQAAPSADPVIFQSSELKIYRAVSRDGVPVIVLTNLGDDGLPLSPSAGAMTGEPALAGGALPHEIPETAPSQVSSEAPAPSDDVKIVIRRPDGSTVDPGSREVTIDDAGGTTVVININPEPKQPSEPPASPALFFPAVFSVPGPICYPDHLPFLGYGPGNQTPVWFGGLGLSSTDRYARAELPCGPSAGRPRASGSSAP